MKYFYKERNGFFTILGTLLAVAIILFLCYLLLNNYFKKPLLDNKTQGVLSEQGINTSNYRTILDSTKDKLKDIEKQALNREGQLY
jgi:predicted membrane protein